MYHYWIFNRDGRFWIWKNNSEFTPYTPGGYWLNKNKEWIEYNYGMTYIDKKLNLIHNSFRWAVSTLKQKEGKNIRFKIHQ